MPASGGTRVTTANTFTLNGIHSTAHVTYVLGSDGSIRYPLDVAGASAGPAGSANVILPPLSVIDSGRPSTSTTKMSFNALGQRVTITGRQTVQGGGTVSVTVPAGTFQAIVVTVTDVTTWEGIRTRLEHRAWFARGIRGEVREQIFTNIAGHSFPVQVKELKSFTKG
jgi:hypothetical protein